MSKFSTTSFDHVSETASCIRAERRAMIARRLHVVINISMDSYICTCSSSATAGSCSQRGLKLQPYRVRMCTYPLHVCVHTRYMVPSAYVHMCTYPLHVEPTCTKLRTPGLWEKGYDFAPHGPHHFGVGGLIRVLVTGIGVRVCMYGS